VTLKPGGTRRRPSSAAVVFVVSGGLVDASRVLLVQLNSDSRIVIPQARERLSGPTVRAQ
jgi:hypothetical protein